MLKFGRLYRYDKYTWLFIRPSGISELDCATTKTDTAESSISIGRESLQVFFCTRGLGVLPGSTARRYSWRKTAFTVNKKAFCVLEFAKIQSIVTVQRRFRIMYHTEPPTDKTIREWYMKFQQSGCLCAAKRTGRPGRFPTYWYAPFCRVCLGCCAVEFGNPGETYE